MKRTFCTAISVFGLCLAGSGKPSALYQNTGYVTNASVIDATSFVNSGVFVASVEDVAYFLTVTGFPGGQYPYSTHDTLNYTNTPTGIMLGQSGFMFQTVTSETVHGARNFVNYGQITGVDTVGTPLFPNYGGTTVFEAGTGVPTPSLLQVMATNIFNRGTMTVGNDGWLQLVGRNVTNSYGALVAGDLTGNDLYDETSVQSTYDVVPVGGGNIIYRYFVAPTSLNDLYWGSTNDTAFKINQFPPLPDTPAENIKARLGLNGTAALPWNGAVVGVGTTNMLVGSAGTFAPYVYFYADPTGTNYYFNIVLVNTNFLDSNISCHVAFSPAYAVQPSGLIPDPNGAEAIVQFSVPSLDVITGQMETNAIYVQDTGAALSNTVAIYTNSSWLSEYERPDFFEISTRTPPEWEFALLDNLENGEAFGLDSLPVLDQVIYPGFGYQYENKTLARFTAASYGVQVGWNPEDVSGNFPFTTELFGTQDMDIPVPTNQPGRIDIEANELDLTGSRIRAEGFVTLQATNLVSGRTIGKDWGAGDGVLGATNGALLISNVFPSTYSRIRGDVFMWAANWENIGSNSVTTNNFTFHLLVVDQSLRGNFTSTIRNLSLKGNKSITLADALTVNNQSLFVTTNLTINNTVHLTQNAGSLTSNNAPKLENLLITTNGALIVDNVLDLGVNESAASQTNLAKRKYSIHSITNLGGNFAAGLPGIEATSPSFQSEFFENDGIIFADTNGSLVIDAAAIGLGLTLTNAGETNYLAAEGNVTLSAETIEAVNSVIYAGFGTEVGQLILQTTPTGRLTDFVSGAPSTNTPLINYWSVNSGFTLLDKPATGDLFGTEITTIASNNVVAQHIWAGVDLGATPAGFVNNEVIGHLKLSRQGTNGLLEFSPAGKKNAMYVDYLELDANSLSYSDYREGLVIDTNFTIYFASANVDPLKLEDAYPNQLVWVPTFAGPNSTVAVPITNSSAVCLMNAALANSQEIASYPGNPPNYVLQHTYNDPYILNSYSNPALPAAACPTGTSTEKAFLLTDSGTNTAMAMILVNGKGRITPAIKQGELTLGATYTLTAIASNGWDFSEWQTTGLTGADVHSNVLSFTLEADTVIVADFVPNPFIGLKGVYNGLFYEASGINPGSAGFVTLALNQSGSFSGRLRMGPESYTFSGKFDGSGYKQVEAKHGKATLSVTLQLDTTGGTDRITGTVDQTGWEANLWADLGLTWTAKKPSPLAGRYTATLPWGTNLPFAGDSYATVTVSKQGLLSALGGLADGTTFSQSVPVSKSGYWPLYDYIASGKDLIMGWVTVTNSGMTSTNVSWSKGTNNGRYYEEGFSNALELAGSPYQAPAGKSPALELTNPVVELSGTDLEETLTNAVGLEKNLSYTSAVVTLNIQRAAGSFSGRFLDTNTGKMEKMSGVVLQNTNSGRGFFLGTNASGSVLLRGD